MIQTERVPWWTGMPEGLIGVLIFSLTMPTMHLALVDFSPTVVGIGRMVIAAVPAALILLISGSPRLTIRQMGSLAAVVVCLVFGFSWLTAAALRHVTSHHAGIVIGGIPLATALCAALRHGQKQPPLFWIASVVGTLLVVGYGIGTSGGRLTGADALLLLAAAVCGMGYVEGARLGREIGTLALSCWVPVVASPFALALCWPSLPEHWASIGLSAWLALFYNGLFSVLIGFIFWYRGLALGGSARIGQIQLAQPFFTLAASAWMIGEALNALDWVTAAAVVGCIAVTQTASQK